MLLAVLFCPVRHGLETLQLNHHSHYIVIFFNATLQTLTLNLLFTVFLLAIELPIICNNYLLHLSLNFFSTAFISVSWIYLPVRYTFLPIRLCLILTANKYVLCCPDNNGIQSI